MVALMLGADPADCCVACAYPEIKTHEDEIWVTRLGHDREQVQQLREGTRRFDEGVIEQIRLGGTLIVNEEVERGLLRERWAYLKRRSWGMPRTPLRAEWRSAQAESTRSAGGWDRPPAAAASC